MLHRFLKSARLLLKFTLILPLIPILGVGVVSGVGVPSVKGMQSAFGDFAVGSLGGLAYSITKALFGSGWIGALAAALMAGSVVKGPRGTALSTVAGFQLFSDALGGGAARGSTTSVSAAGAGTSRRAVM